jgi:polysaccharide export outer membrane protein
MIRIVYLFIAVVFLSSCSSYKQLPYFQDLQESDFIEENIRNFKVLKIQQDDILAITVSSLNPEASAIFNAGNTTFGQIATAPNSATVPNGFVVNSKGDIQLPLIGSITVAGLSTQEARELIQNKLDQYLKEPVVSLRISNLRVSVLGDVGKPGVFPLESERTSIANILSLAGDLNTTALRKNVLLVRETAGKRQYIRLDMTSKELFSSPYYYLQNNDVLYIQPSNAKYASVDNSYRNIGLGLSIVSILVLILLR